MKSLSYKNLRNTGLGKVFKCVMMVILLSVVSFSAAGQKMTVEGMTAKPFDISASKYKRVDLNNQPCALVKVQLAAPGAAFEGNVIGEVEYKVSEYWVYMSKGTRRLAVKCPNYLPVMVEFADYGIKGLESDTTYELVIALPDTGGAKKTQVTSQYVMFRVEPQNAMLEFDGGVLALNAGTATKRMPFGTYFYKVSAPLYHTQESSVDVNDPVNKHIVNVSLLPAYGYITIPATGELSGAKVYVNNEYKGETPYNSGPIASGTYDVSIVKEMYTPLQGKVTVTDNQTTTYSPALKADFAEVSLTTGADSEIWINGEYKGKGTWKGRLSTGTYLVEGRKEYHKSVSKEVAIAPEMQGETKAIGAPTPIYGSLDINSSPADAEITLDGKVIGTTPMYIADYIIGTHAIKITKAGYSTYNENITLMEGETKTIEPTL
ncbi:MAG: PEGA domain-containing protein [Muribaculaceae bacterium]